MTNYSFGKLRTELNDKLKDLAQSLQYFRKKHWNLKKIPTKLFFNDVMGDANWEYFFHNGAKGKNGIEIQFNVGLEDNSVLRYGLAFSFQGTQNFPDPIADSRYRAQAFNEMQKSNTYKLYGPDLKTIKERVTPILGEFWFFGEKVNWNNGILAKTDVERICEVVRDLYPIYESVMINAKYLRERDDMIEKYKVLLDYLPQVILCGPPGTGKTYKAKGIVEGMVCELEYGNISKNGGKLEAQRFRVFERSERFSYSGRWAIVQFHPSYNYEDFVRGIQVKTEYKSPVYETTNRIIGNLALAAKKEWDETKKQHNGDERKTKNEAPKFFLIIDEINRANLSSVMGELIYALEYRGEAVETPYAVNGRSLLSIPKNLYIIGTMNTADRSIGHIDYAVRRRFVFIPCLPKEAEIDNYYMAAPEYLLRVAKALFSSVAKLFDHPDKGCLSYDFHKDDIQVGHTYFMAESCRELAMKFAYQVYPLLREYYKDGVLVPQGSGDIELVIDEQSDFKVMINQPYGGIESDIFKKIYEMCKDRGKEEELADANNNHESSSDDANPAPDNKNPDGDAVNDSTESSGGENEDGL